MPWPPIHRAALVVAVLVALAVVVVLDRPRGRWGRRLRTRFLAGVPWGTLLSGAFVLCVYLFVQGGWNHWYAPVTIPFRAWSYVYPTGILTAAFAHVGPSHLVGNLVGTLVLGTLAEYAWGHFPRERGTTSFGSWRTNPYVRAVVVVPVVVLATGLFTSLFAVGPVIGFSGVVFAFAGFALVFRPIGTVVALSVGNAVRLAYTALTSPTATGQARPVYSSPWWADIAVQGHAIGVFVGVFLATFLLRRRNADARPSALRLATGVVLFGVVQSLWAVYWYRGAESYVLYRALGLALVVSLAAVVAVAVTASDRPLMRVPDVAVGESLRTVPRWQVAAAVLLFVFAAIAGPAVPVNLTTATGEDLPGDPIRVRDYEVTYAENVENGMVSVVDVEVFGETTSVNTSGVIVRSRERNIWLTAVTAGRLGFDGRATVRLGGVGWRDPVTVRREGWTVAGGNTTYRVVFVDGNRTDPAFAADPVTADPVVDGRNVTVAARDYGFDVVVANATGRARAPVPGVNESVVLRGVRVVHREDELVAVAGDTRVPVAKRETYPGQREF